MPVRKLTGILPGYALALNIIRDRPNFLAEMAQECSRRAESSKSYQEALERDMEAYQIKEQIMPNMGYLQLDLGSKLLLKMGRFKEAGEMAKRATAEKDNF